MSRKEGNPGIARSARPARDLAGLSPAYFGLVMATGIVSLAASMMAYRGLGLALFALNVAQYVVLWGLYGLRAWRYPKRFFGDMGSHATGPGYFTVVAATGILASQFMLLGIASRSAPAFSCCQRCSGWC